MDTESYLASRFLAAHPEDAASVLEREPLAAAELLADEGAAPEGVADVLRSMAAHAAAQCLEALPEARASEVVAHLPLERLVLLVRRMDEDVAERLLAALPEEEAAGARALLRYPPGSAGALMDPTVRAFTSDTTVGDAIERLRSDPQHSVYYLYVTARDGTLAGVLNTRELVLAKPDAPVSNAMITRVARIDAGARRQEILAHPAWRAYHALPVVDAQNRFLGVIHYETLRALERAEQPSPAPTQALSTALLLAERVWIGLSNVLEGIPPGAAETRGKPR